jgi:hypothetical protein
VIFVVVMIVVNVSPRPAPLSSQTERIDSRAQLAAERRDAIDGVGGALMNAFEALLLLRQPAIDALEPLENLRTHLLQPQHA